MGTHGRTGIHRYVAGSVAERVVRLSPVPVLTARETETSEDPGEYDDILVPTDGSEYAAVAIEHGLAIAERFDARIHAVNIIDVGAITVGPDATPPTDLVERLTEQGNEAVEQIARRARDQGLDVTTEVREGAPAKGILGYVEENQIDLITMGTRYQKIPGLLYSSDPSGSLSTGESLDVQVANAQAANVEAQDYLDGDRISFGSKPLSYSPVYTRYNEAPDYILEHGNLMADFGDEREMVSHSSPVQGREIRLTTMTSDMHHGSRSSAQLQTESLSASDTLVPVESSGGHIQIAFQTHLSLEQWEYVLSDEIDLESNAGDESDGNERFIAELDELNAEIEKMWPRRKSALPPE
jgi:nucleotide-binding universal stress UspA family protein